MSRETASRSLGHLLQGLHRVPWQQPGVQRDGGKYVSQSHIDRGGRAIYRERRGRDARNIFCAPCRASWGRLLLPEDGKPGAADVAVVSEDLWRRHFGSNPTPLSESFQQTLAIRMALPVTTCGFL